MFQSYIGFVLVLLAFSAVGYYMMRPYLQLEYIKTAVLQLIGLIF